MSEEQTSIGTEKQQSVFERNQEIMDRMKEEHPELSDKEIRELQKSARNKEEQRPITVAGLNVSKKVGEVLHTSVPGFEDLGEGEQGNLANFASGLESAIQDFRGEKNEIKEKAAKVIDFSEVGRQSRHLKNVS